MVRGYASSISRGCFKKMENGSRVVNFLRCLNLCFEEEHHYSWEFSRYLFGQVNFTHYQGDFWQINRSEVNWILERIGTGRDMSCNDVRLFGGKP